MASYLRPLRGPKSAAIAQLDETAPLKKGEIFFEYPETGPGTGIGKMKMGDGVSSYLQLPYFMDFSSSIVEFTDTTEPDDTSIDELLEDIAPLNSAGDLLGYIKHFLVNFKKVLSDSIKDCTDAISSLNNTKAAAAKSESSYNTTDYAKAVNLGTDRSLVFNLGDDNDPRWVSTRFYDTFYENTNWFTSSKAIFDYYGYPTKVYYRKINGVRGITFVKGVPQIHIESLTELNPDVNDVISVRFFYENHQDNRAVSSSATAYPVIMPSFINSYEIAVTCEAVESNYTITSNCAWIYVYYRRLPS